MLPLVGEGKPKPILETPFSQWSARVSPDGRWLAYNSNESGRAEAYIQPFQTPGEKLRLSVNGSGPLSWRGDGKELFYLALDGTMMAVPIQAGATLEPGIPQQPLHHRRGHHHPTGRHRRTVDNGGVKVDHRRGPIRIGVEYNTINQ